MVMTTRVRALIEDGWHDATLTDQHAECPYGEFVVVVDGEDRPRGYRDVFCVECFDDEAHQAAVAARFATGA